MYVFSCLHLTLRPKKIFGAIGLTNRVKPLVFILRLAALSLLQC